MPNNSINTLETDLLTKFASKLELTLTNCLEQFVLANYLNKQPIDNSPKQAPKSLCTKLTFELKNVKQLQCSKIAYEQLNEAIKYSVFSGGKRIRPLLCLLVANYCQTLLACQQAISPVQAGQKAECENELSLLADLNLHLALAIELIHSYSLVHDDLPAMDDAVYRRGKLTVHKQFGEAVAILVGDALLTLAFGQLNEVQGDFKPDTYKRILAVQAELANLAGLNGMVAGQMLDLSIAPKDCTLADYLACISGKTAALLEAAICLPSKLYANLSLESESNLAKLAYYWGILFQIQDDFLDKAEVGQEKNILQYIAEPEFEKWESELNNEIQSSLEAIFASERKNLDASVSFAQLNALQAAEQALLQVLKKLERRKQ